MYQTVPSRMLPDPSSPVSPLLSFLYSAFFERWAPPVAHFKHLPTFLWLLFMLSPLKILISSPPLPLPPCLYIITSLTALDFPSHPSTVHPPHLDLYISLLNPYLSPFFRLAPLLYNKPNIRLRSSSPLLATSLTLAFECPHTNFKSTASLTPRSHNPTLPATCCHPSAPLRHPDPH